MSTTDLHPEAKPCTGSNSSRMTMRDRISTSAANMMKHFELGFSSVTGAAAVTTATTTTMANNISGRTLGVKETLQPQQQLFEGEGSLEQALRHLFASCTTGASGTVAAAEHDTEKVFVKNEVDDDDTSSDGPESCQKQQREITQQPRIAPVAAAPVCLIPSEETTSTSSSHHHYPSASTKTRRGAAGNRPSQSPDVREETSPGNNAAAVSLRNLSAMRNNDFRATINAKSSPNKEETTSIPHHQRGIVVSSIASSFSSHEHDTPKILRKQQHIFKPLVSTTAAEKPSPMLRKLKQQQKQQTYTIPTQDLGSHIYEHLFLEEVPVPTDYQQPDDRSQTSKHLLPRMGITPTPRLFPASSPDPPDPNKNINLNNHSFLMIHAVPSEDEISAISAQTLEAMAQVSSRDSYKVQSKPSSQTMLINNGYQQQHSRLMTTYGGIALQPQQHDGSFEDSHNSSSRYSTPHSRSTTEDSSRSFEQWQNSEREYWKSQQGPIKPIQPGQRRRQRPQSQRKGDATMSTASSTRHEYQSSSSNHTNELAEI